MIIKTGKGDAIASGTVGKIEYKKIPTKTGGEFSILEFSLAYDYDKNAEQGKKTSYLNCKIFGDYADKARFIVDKEKYMICGKITIESYINRDGEEKTKEVFEVDTILPNISVFLNDDNQSQTIPKMLGLEEVDAVGKMPF